ncbi:hypothetical protein RXV86_16210 [Alisedimentitalea sp. MJ-SS2]|uniref:hypothetical protein n=1 Tax=Aliisedimentitalea sp. MJ-SS2 TaxID=3049795 RepID=UPI0029114C21|nr:hypothetical protein [Alisedimentitalea sp. MJ-SS2]MDU8928938.1 hypothetical protein [Alisedimentitalea sp. MJ-SS2]
MRTRFWGTVLACCVAAGGAPDAATAKDRILRCELRQDGYYGGTPPEVHIAYKPGESRMVVYDSFLHFLEAGPVWGRVDRDNDRRFIIRWKVDDMKTDSGHTMDWRMKLSWDKKTGRATITGKAAVSDDDNNGSGKCFFKK